MALVIPEFGDGQVEEDRYGDEDEADNAADGVEHLQLLVKGVQVCQGGTAAARKRYCV